MKIKTLLLPEEITQAKDRAVRAISERIQQLTLKFEEHAEVLIVANGSTHHVTCRGVCEASKQVQIIAEKLKYLYPLLVSVRETKTLEELYEISVPDYLFE